MIQSFLDTDLYKFKMSYFLWKNYKDKQATFEFIDRDKKIRLLGMELKGLREEIDSLIYLPITDVFDGFSDMDCSWWMDLQQEFKKTLPVVTQEERGLLQIKVSGPWWVVTMWETFVLSIVSELLGGRVNSPAVYMHKTKFERAKAVFQDSDIKIFDYGTRRRLSSDWQDYILEKSGFLKGTSNVHFGLKYEIPIVGTMAHELFMGVAALYDHAPSSIKGSQQVVLKQWADLYGAAGSYALTDTWTNEAFFSDFTVEQWREWGGVRHDSGDPLEYMKQVWERLKFAEAGKKKIIFSDGLSLPKILLIADQAKIYDQTIEPVFGWGTGLMNNGDVAASNIVMKLTEVDGHTTVKLSDAYGKRLGTAAKQNMYSKAFKIDY